LRGVVKVDDEGVGAFDTLFPGHYSGRAHHIHILTHMNGTIYGNNTFQSSNVAHVGQLFFQEDLISEVEATYPYNTNTIELTTNDEDMWAPSQADNNYDPFADYAYLGNDVSDGLLMWISIGINTSASYSVSVAGSLTAEGGVTNSDSDLGGGGSGNGTAPSGNGTAPGNSTATVSGSISLSSSTASSSSTVHLSSTSSSSKTSTQTKAANSKGKNNNNDNNNDNGSKGKHQSSVEKTGKNEAGTKFQTKTKKH